MEHFILEYKEIRLGKVYLRSVISGNFKAFSAMQLSVSCKWLNSKVGLKVFMKFCEPFAFTLVSYRLCNKLHKDRAEHTPFIRSDKRKYSL